MKKERERESVSKERRRSIIRTIFRERRSDLRTTHKRSYYHFAPRLGNFHMHQQHIIIIIAFFQKPFFLLIVFVKGRRSKRQNISQRRTVIPKKVYHHQECVCVCVCAHVCSRARICASSFAREDKKIRDDKERTYFIHPCASTSSQDVIL